MPEPDVGDSRSTPRASSALRALLAGLAIDAVDLATLGPVGLYGGLVLGGLAGWLLAPQLGVPPRHRVWCAVAAGIYCTTPATALLPLATLVALLTAGASWQGRAAVPARSEAGADVIEVDFQRLPPDDTGEPPRVDPPPGRR